jgi:hypothetical protein
VFATSLCGTDLFAWLMDRMRADPRACALAYNAAVSEFAEAGIAPLKVDDADGIVELPLWHIRTAPEKIGGVIVREGPRRRIFAADLAALDVTELAPRALLMTAMLRLAGCDLFIHGTGGGGYDRITDLWIQAWLGFTLAPVAVVTATLLLPLGSSPVSVDEIDRAAWLAHRARHDPALLGDDRAAQQKADLVAQIRARKGARTDRGLLFARLRALLEAQRTAHADRIAKFDRDAAAAGESRADAAIRAERTWAFPLYPEPELARLKQSIENAFAGAG